MSLCAWHCSTRSVCSSDLQSSSAVHISLLLSPFYSWGNQFAPGCAPLSTWQLWAGAGGGCLLWAGYMLSISPQPLLAHYTQVHYLPSLACGHWTLERSRRVIGVKLLFFTLSHLSLVYPSLPCYLWSPRAHLSQADLTPLLLCGRIRARSLVSVQTSSGRCYMRLSGMN